MRTLHTFMGWSDWHRNPTLGLMLLLSLVAVKFLLGFITRDQIIMIMIRDKTGLRDENFPLSAVIKNPLFEESYIKNNTLNDTVLKKYIITKTGSASQFITKMDNVKDIVNPEDKLMKTVPLLPLCDSMPPDLGPVQVYMEDLDMKWVEKKYPQVRWGGSYLPPNCIARRKAAIIVPYRDRQQHLTIFLNHMHSFLIKQQTEYRIFIIEQDDNQLFNRAKLFNVGFVESQKLEPSGWQCFIMHDIDLLPVDTRNMYSCSKQPKHMSAAVNKFNQFFTYDTNFGGVSALTRDQFIKVNGFSNMYWGWGSEDDDMFRRLGKMNYHVASYKISIARYSMINHLQAAPNKQRFEVYEKTSEMLQNDGLSNLEYELKRVVEYHLYTHVLVNIGKPE